MSELHYPSERTYNWPAGFESAPSILLVDDEPNILNAMRRLLRPEGYRLLIAGSGEEALEILRNEMVDLIISDMRMPGMDGAHLLGQARELWPSILRILLTGYSDITSTIAAINKGEIFRYISKPWNDKEMLTTVHRALEQRGLEIEHKRLQILTYEQNDALKTLNASLEQKVLARTAALAKANEELSHSHERLKRSFLTSIKVFSNLIEMRAGPLAGHSRRVAELSRRMAERRGLPRSDSQDVMLAGLLHEIGKIGFPDTLLTKPTSMIVGDDLELLKKHPIKGATALMALEDLHGAAVLIRQQHERHDGKGFPDGIYGSAISEGARILALATDYDAAQLGLRFPGKFTAQEARDWIVKGKGTRYAADIVDTFLDIVGRPQNTEFQERRVASKDLLPGMILERDLITHDGVLLVGTGHVLDAALIQQICDLEKVENVKIAIWIRCL